MILPMNLPDQIHQANQLLAPYAVPHEGRLGRAHSEPADDMRFPFARDRARIIHSQAFRRLQGKTQVFAAGVGDHYRTRLTHTMEVAQIARDIARAMRLNEDLTECIALAHDLGHPPFGHAGEETLDAWMKGHGHHFEHNEQSERIVTVLEEHSRLYPGLNPEREVIEGLRKHTGPPASAESALVNIADEIAYCGHDCDDGLAEGLFELSDLLTVPLAQRAHTLTKKRGTALRGALIRLLADDLLDTSLPLLQNGNISVDFSPSLRADLKQLRSFLWTHMYHHPSVTVRTRRGQELLRLLCDAYHAHPTDKIVELQQRTGSDLPEAVKDYTAGMTDTFAENQARELRLID